MFDSTLSRVQECEMKVTTTVVRSDSYPMKREGSWERQRPITYVETKIRESHNTLLVQQAYMWWAVVILGYYISTKSLAL